MTAPIAPDALREAVAHALYEGAAGGGSSIPAWTWEEQSASARRYWLNQAHVVLAVVAKHRDAEVERLRAEAKWAMDKFARQVSVANGFWELAQDATAKADLYRTERDAAQDRITRALAEMAPAGRVYEILSGTDQEPG